MPDAHWIIDFFVLIIAGLFKCKNQQSNTTGFTSRASGHFCSYFKPMSLIKLHLHPFESVLLIIVLHNMNGNNFDWDMQNYEFKKVTWPFGLCQYFIELVGPLPELSIPSENESQFVKINMAHWRVSLNALFWNTWLSRSMIAYWECW